MQTPSLLLAAVTGSSQSAIPSTPPPAQGSASAATTIIPDIALSWGGYFKGLAILCFALAALWALLWVLKRAGGSGSFAPSPSMRIESRLALGPKNWLYVVRCQDKRLILGVSEKNISLVSESALTEEELNAPAKPSLFSLKGKPALLSGLKNKLGDKSPRANGRASGAGKKTETAATPPFDDFMQEEQGRQGL